MDTAQDIKNDPIINALFKAGAHYGYSKSRRHPSVKPFIFTVKNHVDIFNLEKAKTLLEEALAFAQVLGKEGKQVLFISGKHEALASIQRAAADTGMPNGAG